MKGYQLNPDPAYVSKIVTGILKKEGHCPCRIKREESTLCPCDEFTRHGSCKCDLFVKIAKSETK